MIKQLITKGAEDFKADLEELLRGGVIEKTIDDGIVFPDLKTDPDMVWSLLLFSGYLTLDTPYCYGTPTRLRIPNREVNELFKSTVLEWFKKSIMLKNF